jgi:hypothetical protein
MKKIFTLIIALGALTTVFAQSGRRGDYGNNGYNNYSAGAHTQSYYPSENRGSYDNRGGHEGYQTQNYDRNRQAEMDRVSRDYNNRIDGYRRDRSLSTYERDRRIYSTQRERDQKLKLIGGGLIVGGILALLEGSH